MAGGLTVADVKARTCKARDSWWTVLLVDPLAVRLVWLVSRFRWITPNRLTATAFVLGLGAAAAFATATRTGLILGAILFHLSFVVDCMDGKVARLTRTSSPFGAWLDYVLDRVRVLACAIALFGGQYAATGDDRYVFVCGSVVFLDMFRYLNALHISQTRKRMRKILTAKIQKVFRSHPPDGSQPNIPAIDERPDLAIEQDFQSRFRGFTRLRNRLYRARIRAHLFSGIEFQMAVFIIGPLAGALIVTPIAAGILLLVFELGLIYKLWLASRSFARYCEELDNADTPLPQPTVGGQRRRRVDAELPELSPSLPEL